MSNHEERRKSLITLSSVIQAADDSKYKQSLDECENECTVLKSRIKALESLLARAGEEMVWLVSVVEEELHEYEKADAKQIISEIDAILPSTDLHDSDCATHNMPAYPNGPCDCSLATEVDKNGL